jgi:hypothetical protein
MLNNTETLKIASLVSVYVALRDSAMADMEAASRAVRAFGKSGSTDQAEEDRLDAAFDVVWEALEEAQDNLREVRDGYRHTYPHPVCSYPHGKRYPLGGR